VKLELLKLKVATAAIAVILFAANIQITNAHQQHQQDQQQQGGLFRLFLQQLLTSEPATVENGTSTTTFQSTNDSFRVQMPQDWIIQDRNNADFSLAAEVLRGYGLLAQFCPAEQQQGALLVDAGGNTSTVSNSTSDNSNSCQRAQEVIHVLRYPNLGARLELDSDNNVTATNGSNISPDTILAFQMLKLQEVGYSDIRIVDSKDTTIDVTSSLLNNRAIATIPAKLVEMTYSTNLDPNETRTGYFLSTATDLTPRNLGMTTGYGIFYERNSPIAAETMTASSITTTTTLPTPVPVAQVFDSFELMAGAEVELAILASLNALLVQAASEEEKAAADVLKVEIDSSDTEGTAPATFEFEADITGGTKPYTVGWDIDDDGITESNEQTLVARFNEAGTYKIVLTVADIKDQIASDTLKIKVEEEQLSPVDEKDDKKESQIEGTTQEQNQCNSLYPIACIDNLLNLYGLGSP
jgi:PKD domain